MAFGVEASDVVIAINESAERSASAFGIALQEAIENVDFAGVRIDLRRIPDVYIVGEETALLEVLQGRAAWPTRKPPFPIERGLEGLPTLVQNVETVAHLPFILSAGAAAYRARGVDGKGPALCTLGSEFARPGVYEIPLGMPIRDLLFDVGGGLRSGECIKAIQPGGPSSGFLAPANFGLSLDANSLKACGSALGCAAIKGYSERDCMVRVIGGIMKFFAHSSCGQCSRCRMETQMLDAIVSKVLEGKGSWKLLGQVDGLVRLAAGQGICTLIGMPVAPILTGLELFRGEFSAHIDGACPLCAAHSHICDMYRRGRPTENE